MANTGKRRIKYVADSIMTICCDHSHFLTLFILVNLPCQLHSCSWLKLLSMLCMRVVNQSPDVHTITLAHIQPGSNIVQTTYLCPLK